MDKFETRRATLAKLVASIGHGGIARVAQAIDKPANYVSRMLYEPGKPGRKRIGEDTLEDLIRAFPDWFHPLAPGAATASQSVSSQREMLAAAMKLVHLVRDRSLSPLTEEEEERVRHAAVDVVFEVGARAILDDGVAESAYGQVMERARSGGR